MQMRPSGIARMLQKGLRIHLLKCPDDQRLGAPLAEFYLTIRRNVALGEPEFFWSWALRGLRLVARGRERIPSGPIVPDGPQGGDVGRAALEDCDSVLRLAR